MALLAALAADLNGTQYFSYEKFREALHQSYENHSQEFPVEFTVEYLEDMISKKEWVYLRGEDGLLGVSLPPEELSFLWR